jgi:hypothetical protein
MEIPLSLFNALIGASQPTECRLGGPATVTVRAAIARKEVAQHLGLLDAVPYLNGVLGTVPTRNWNEAKKIADSIQTRLVGWKIEFHPTIGERAQGWGVYITPPS